MINISVFATIPITTNNQTTTNHHYKLRSTTNISVLGYIIQPNRLLLLFRNGQSSELPKYVEYIPYSFTRNGGQPGTGTARYPANDSTRIQAGPAGGSAGSAGGSARFGTFVC